MNSQLIAAIQTRTNPVDFPFHINHSMSTRVMSCIEEMVPRLEVYSVDEGFCDCTGMEMAMPYED
ncbi:Y-family DNA polymerase, partial [Pantoea agglomerans]|uniref:Y-family DNA polymerase n=1 Tax=Enterobacter agglomerans TaxID=549 RepID=UPI00403AF2FB